MKRALLLACAALAAPARGGTAEDFAAAVARYEARAYSAARRDFQSLAAAGRADPEIDFYLGRLALWFDDRDAALRHLQRAAAAAPRDARICNALGDAFGLAAQQAPLWQKLSWAKQCLAAYERAAELDPDNPAWRWSLLGFYCVAPRMAGGSREKALAQAAAIRARDPMGGRIAHATLHLADGRAALAFAEFEPVLRERPDDFLALYHIGRCAALSGEQLERGRRALERCLDLVPPPGDGMPSHASARHRLGDIYTRLGDAARAKREYARALEANPDFRADKMALKN